MFSGVSISDGREKMRPFGGATAGFSMSRSNACSMAKRRIRWPSVQTAYDLGMSPLECSIEFEFGCGA